MMGGRETPTVQTSEIDVGRRGSGRSRKKVTSTGCSQASPDRRRRSSGSGSKRQKEQSTIETNNRMHVNLAENDRFNSLPEHLIHSIFERLSAKDVVKTSILSKKWRYKWTTMGALVEGGNLGTMLSYLPKNEFFVIDGEFLKFLVVEEISKRLSHANNSLKSLVLINFRPDDLGQLHGAIFLIRNSPNLETLIVQMGPQPIDSDVERASNYLKALDFLDRRTLNKLQTVEITSVEASKLAPLFYKTSTCSFAFSRQNDHHGDKSKGKAESSAVR